jgi:CTP synthase
LVPTTGKELKSKPAQQAAALLRSLGVSPEFILCRSQTPITQELIAKISTFCMIQPSNVISAHDVKNLYEIPLLFAQQQLPKLILDALKIHKTPPEISNLAKWSHYVQMIQDPNLPELSIALIGKYTKSSDAYLSVEKALEHAGIANKIRINIVYFDSENLENNNPDLEETWKQLKNTDIRGVLVCGGFGVRGIEGKIAAIRYARENNIPFLGICLGLQCAVIEACRNMLELKDANSEEFSPTAKDLVVVNIPEIDKNSTGDTMCLGVHTTTIKPNTLASLVYNGALTVDERHRHRYQVNIKYKYQLEEIGFVFSGSDNDRMEILEMDSKFHKFFFATQYHAEWQSRLQKPSPPFVHFIKNAM